MTPIRVIKIGGSLLQRDSLLADLQAWQESLVDPMTNVWIVGGGAEVDVIRKQNLQHGQSDHEAHWSSIEVMDSNASMMTSRIPDWQLTANPQDVLQSDHGLPLNFLLQTKNWLIAAAQDASASPQLPASWDVTSDSIAAWTAIKLHAAELILLKSCDIPNATIAELTCLGIIDNFLPSLNLSKYDLRFICQQLPYSSN